MQFLTPEEREVTRRTEALKELVKILSERELKVASLKNELNRFRQKYAQKVGRLYAELDRLDALMAIREAESDPTPIKLKTATDAKTQAQKCALEVGLLPIESFEADLSKLEEVVAIHPSEELKRLYRKAVMRFHPDRATSEAERMRRTSLMAELTVAYAKGDLQAIKEMLDRAGSDPEEITGEDIGSQLIRLIRRETQITRRLAELEVEEKQLTRDEIFTLWQSVSSRESDGGDPLGELVAQIQVQIAERRDILNSLV